MNNEHNIISNFCRKVKDKINDLTLEMKIENQFKRNHNMFKVYKKNSFIPELLYGYNSKGIVVYGNQINKINCLIMDVVDEKVYLIRNASLVDIRVIYNEVEYIRKGTRFQIDENIEKVEVIKVNDKYYKI